VRALVTAAAASYAATCTLGVAVASGRVDTSRSRWMHHALYVCTVTLGGAAVGTAASVRAAAGWWLLPAAAPLGVLPVAGGGRRHAAIALAAAPFFAGGLLKAWS